MFNEPKNGSRGSGRTTAMIELARMLVKSGRHVWIVGGSRESAQSIAEEVRSKLATPLCKMVQPASVFDAGVDIEAATIAGDREAVVLVDHFGLESYVKHLKSMLGATQRKLDAIRKVLDG